jgi:hypothetical protein
LIKEYSDLWFFPVIHIIPSNRELLSLHPLT